MRAEQSQPAAHRERNALRAVVEGRVQGVGFRAATLDKALGLGLVGYVTNLWDGNVEVVAEGPSEDLSRFLAWLERGPSYARVDRVVVQWLAPSGHYERFEVR